MTSELREFSDNPSDKLSKLSEFNKFNRWDKIDEWYKECTAQIYPEPSCGGHRRGMKEVIKRFVVPRLGEIKTVLDVGCGTGDASRYFKALGVVWVGVTLGEYDLGECRRKGLRVFEYDMHWVRFPPRCVDMVFARHVVEHSPMPLMALKHWAELTRKYCIVVTPKPPFFELPHPNHYSVMSQNQWEGLFNLAGLEVVDDWQIPDQIEYRWLLRKMGS